MGFCFILKSGLIGEENDRKPDVVLRLCGSMASRPIASPAAAHRPRMYRYMASGADSDAGTLPLRLS